MDKVFKALADPSRRKLLDRLRAENVQTLGQLCAHLDMTLQAVTKRQAMLEEANLVVLLWRGCEKLHSLNPVPMHADPEREGSASCPAPGHPASVRGVATTRRPYCGGSPLSPTVRCLALRTAPKEAQL